MEYKIKKKLDLVEYMGLVENIVEEYFDDEGNYVPHFGELNAMRLFYNHCVENDIEGFEDHNIIEPLDLKTLIEDDDFLKVFYKEICGMGDYFTFGEAYRTALDIVKSKLNSISSIIDYGKKVIVSLAEKLSKMFDNTKVEELTQLLEKVSNGDLNAETIVKAYTDSK